MTRDIPKSKEKPNPLDIAARRLDTRLVVREGSGFWLDGQPASMDTVMRATNAALKRDGQEQLGPEKWRVE